MVIAHLLHYADRERIMRNAYRRTQISQFDDIPKELIDLRKNTCQLFIKLGKQERGQLLESPNQINYLLMANLSLRYHY